MEAADALMRTEVREVVLAVTIAQQHIMRLLNERIPRANEALGPAPDGRLRYNAPSLGFPPLVRAVATYPAADGALQESLADAWVATLKRDGLH